MTYKGYLIDLDGTIYKGKNRIPAGERFIQRLQERNIPYVLVTNNSTRTPEKVQEMLSTQFNVHTPLETIYTATMATIDYMNDLNRGKTVYVIGETGLKTAIAEAGYVEDTENPAYVVVGLDNDLTYEKLAVATLAIHIMAGIQNDIATLLVTTGFTKPEEVPTLPVKPNHVLASFDEWNFDEN